LSTKISICNRALRLLGGQRIAATTEDNEAARILTDVWDDILAEVMAAYPWNFAIKRVALVLLVATPTFGYTNAFQLPVGCLRVLNTENTEDSNDEEWKIEADTLVTDEATCKIRYIALITDVAKYSPGFCSAMAIRLASEIAFPLTNNQNMAIEKFKEYELKIKFMTSLEGKAGSREAIEDSSWIDERS